MAPKSLITRLVAAVGRLPAVSTFIRQPFARGLLAHIPGKQILYGNGWDALHPFDRDHGTDTSGFVSAEHLPADESSRSHAVFYAGSQPSVVRTGLNALPPVDTCTFIDLGCGKGRPLLVASEFPFRAILGVELSPSLAAIARRNAAILSERFPQRTTIQVLLADASTFVLPPGDLVLFLYNPFDAELIARLVAGIETALTIERRSVYIVYYNPVAGYRFDASPLLTRRYARMVPYAADEIGYGPDEADPLVIWQGGTAPPAAEGGNGRIVVAEIGSRANIEDAPDTGVADEPATVERS
jgi:SAM-dependent methyltransferase